MSDPFIDDCFGSYWEYYLLDDKSRIQPQIYLTVILSSLATFSGFNIYYTFFSRILWTFPNY